MDEREGGRLGEGKVRNLHGVAVEEHRWARGLAGVGRKGKERKGEVEPLVWTAGKKRRGMKGMVASKWRCLVCRAAPSVR